MSDPVTHLLRLACDEATARAVSDLLTETFGADETAAAAFEAAPARKGERAAWTVEVFFAAAPDEAQVRGLVALAAGAETAGRVEFAQVEQSDWVARSLAGLAAVRAGRFVVHGAHERHRLRPNDIGLEIEAALAFGTGHHGTTRGCLLMLEGVVKRRRPRHVVDIGTGTGVLALAAARALRRRVAAGDIDADSVTCARENMRVNGAAALVRPLVARGLAHPRLRARRLYDLVFANILARPLRGLAPAIAAAAAPGCELILSGLLAQDVAGVVSAYAAQGFHLRRRLNLEGWATLLLANGGSPRPKVAIVRRRKLA